MVCLLFSKNEVYLWHKAKREWIYIYYTYLGNVNTHKAGGQRDCSVLASVAQWPEIQPLVSRGQFVSADLT